MYYITAGVCVLGMLAIGYVTTWEGSRDFGKKADYVEKSIEMNELESKETPSAGENRVMVDITNTESPMKSSAKSPDELSNTPTTTEPGESVEPVEPVEPSNKTNPVEMVQPANSSTDPSTETISIPEKSPQ